MRTKLNMYSKKCTREYVGTIQVVGHWHIKYSDRDTTGLPSKQTHSPLFKNVINANVSPPFLINHQKSLP